MIADSYKLLVCPDPECEYWEDGNSERFCPDYDSHPLGDPPELVEITVVATNVSHALVKGSWRRRMLASTRKETL